MQSLKYSEDVPSDDEDTTNLYLFTDEKPMDKLLELLTKLLDAETMEKADLDTAESMYAENKGSENPDAEAMFTKVMEKKATQFACGD